MESINTNHVHIHADLHVEIIIRFQLSCYVTGKKHNVPPDSELDN